MDYLGDSDIHELKKIMSLIDADHGDLTELLGGPVRQTPVTVRLGPELKPIDLANLSLITASYDVGDHGTGMIALLGPTQMPYSKMIGLLDVFREELAKRLTDYYANFDQW